MRKSKGNSISNNIMINKKAYIDKYVLEARMGKKEGYEHLRKMFDFLLYDIFNSFCTVYPFLKNKKISIYHDFYIVFWNAINSYKFKENQSFGSHLRKTLIAGVQQILRSYYSFEKEAIAEESLINKLICRKSIGKNGIFGLKVFKFLTRTQREAILLNVYERIPRHNCRIFLNKNRNIFNKRMKFAYNNIRKNLNKVRIENKKVKYKERVYRIVQEKIKETVQ